jgi:hypothetical protein
VHLVQLLLPVRDPDGQPFPRQHFDTLAHELTDRFGGVTAYTRAPAAGLWEEPSGDRVRDDVVVYEVMAEDLDPAWWADLRKRLERDFKQDELVIRTHPIQRL